MWNHKALEAIGNMLGRFIKIDEEVMLWSDRRMVKILVEIDVHGGILDTIEIEWCDMVITQRLDYLGVPFCFPRCRQIGHLEKDCRVPFGRYSNGPHLDDTVTNGYSLEVETLERVKYLGDQDLDCSPLSTTTFVGKLRHYVPSL
jgi:hypothetical protein